MEKTELRKSAIAQLKNHSKSDKQAIEKKLTTHLVTSTLWKNANTIGITMAQGYEWETKLIIEHAWEQNKTICVPKCNPVDKKLTFYQLTSYDQLEIVYYNLKEPKPNRANEIGKAAIDLLIVPGLVFDKSGFRIGFGGGYYDRFLMDYPNETASLMHQNQIVEELPREEFDLPVHYLITDKGINRIK
ncbi:5-formyltetrahydrofolate cyclo-ligase [Virgibacillus natechei]|uniref:5-formyltetrahydrofolate cyclo-ligase n=1 Tax=Virgibacillus natechei TaxID=1216297 RepID=A0ABS4IP28_9BACI|nr:5-formyltetrahydrofolate cyclo-ligase [Virgibacillus natechei]MBP1971769.1 5-formyltetrahydrofolate cyclo-ligase [Virgibacillus natechei]UZD11474.1 5-formyltetrahydrofolate cyclo-ligase [Virgibacillus natechei]